jgi:hypothetical protein
MLSIFTLKFQEAHECSRYVVALLARATVFVEASCTASWWSEYANFNSNDRQFAVDAPRGNAEGCICDLRPRSTTVLLLHGSGFSGIALFCVGKNRRAPWNSTRLHIHTSHPPNGFFDPIVGAPPRGGLTRRTAVATVY